MYTPPSRQPTGQTLDPCRKARSLPKLESDGNKTTQDQRNISIGTSLSPALRLIPLLFNRCMPKVPGSTFRKNVKNSVGNSFNHFRPGSRWDTPSAAVAASGSRIGRGKQAEWQNDVDQRSQTLLGGKQPYPAPDHHHITISTATGLSQTGQQMLHDIQSREQSSFDNNVDDGPDAWEDVDEEDTPMDDDIILSAEGGEMEILQEHAGV
jgi:hypothetical protein